MPVEEPDELHSDHRPAAEDGPFTLIVDGEIFTVTISPRGGANYAWDSGPNPGYGFGSGPVRIARQWIGDPPEPLPPLPDPPIVQQLPPTIEEHRRSIRGFLDQINPETGYIGD